MHVHLQAESETQWTSIKKWWTVVMLLIFGIFLPTLDGYSDMKLAYTAFSTGHPLFAISLVGPVIVNMIFQIGAFWKYEEQKLWTWPLLILQLWHQYR